MRSRSQTISVTIKSHEVAVVESALSQYSSHLYDDIEEIVTTPEEEPQENWEREVISSLMVIETLRDILIENKEEDTPVELRVPVYVTDEVKRKLCQFGNDIVANSSDKQEARRKRDILYTVSERVEDKASRGS